MRRLLLPLILFISLSSFACDSNFNQLCKVNAEWKNQSDGQRLASVENFNSNKTFDDWIATHLMVVEQTLRQRSTEQLTILQKQNRLRLLDELNTYWHNRDFPVNDYLSFKNPVFIDRKGNYCAVGYLMKQSGAESLAHAIDTQNKFAYVKEIKTKGVKEWADKNGFTLDELAWIQPGYPVSFSAQGLSGGLNGTVNCMTIDPTSNVIYAGGSFTSSTKGNTCNRVAAYISGVAGWDWISLGDGVNGVVNTLLLQNNKLYAGGEFTMAGSVPVSNIAEYDMITGQWQAMGSLDNAVNALALYNNEIYAGGKFSGFISKWTGSQWLAVDSGYLYGEGVRTLEVWNNTLMIGGNFELPTGALRKNVATYDGVYMGNSGFGTTTPVNDFEIYRDTLYAACDFIQGTDSCSLAMLSNSDWEVVLKPFQIGMSYFTGTNIRHLLAADGQLFCAGTFEVWGGLYYGNNLMKFDRDISGQAICYPMLTVDSGIHTIAARGNTICFGGAFVTAGTDSLNHIGEFSNSILSVKEPSDKTSESLDVFPNPATDKINIHFKDFSTNENCKVKILDLNGREIYKQEIIQQLFSIDLTSQHANGIYLLQVIDGRGGVVATKNIILDRR